MATIKGGKVAGKQGGKATKTHMPKKGPKRTQREDSIEGVDVQNRKSR